MSPSKIMNPLHFFIRRHPKSDNSLSTITSEEQLINFEHKKKEILLDYEKPPKEIVTSILKLTLDNQSVDLFKEEHPLNKQTSFLLCIYYLKLQHSHNPDFKQLKLNSSSLEAWVDDITDQHIKLPQEIVNQITYKDGIITINSKTFNNPVINLNKYSRTSYFPSNPKYTNKLDKHKIGQIYHNANGVCNGLTTYVLETRAKAKQFTERNKGKEITALLKNLQLNSDFSISRKIYKVIQDLDKRSHIISLPLIKIFNISNHNRLLQLRGIIHIAEIMNNANINNTFIKCRTHDHVVYLEVTKYGDYFKYLYYDPIDKKAWFSIYFHKDELTLHNDRMNSFFSNLEYFEHCKNKRILQTVLEVYTSSTYSKKPPIIELTIPDDIDGQVDLLMIAIDKEDNNIFKQILEQLSPDVDLNKHYQKFTPLIWAIKKCLYEPVKLLLQDERVDPHLRALSVIGPGPIGISPLEAAKQLGKQGIGIYDLVSKRISNEFN